MMERTPLSRIPGLKRETIHLMKSLDIASVEELVARHTALGSDTASLAKALEMKGEELDGLLSKAKGILPDEVVRELTSAPSVDEMPFGALDPKDLVKDRGTQK